MSRVQIQLEITAESPISLGSKKALTSSEIFQYIPGRVLRGALASSLLNMAPEHSTEICSKDCDFCLLFNSSEQAVFRNAYPAAAGVEEQGSRPAPVTLMRCKQNADHKQQDVLSSLLVNHILGVPGTFSCTECGGRLEKSGGFVPRHSKNSKQVNSPSEKQLVRVGIDRVRRTSADEILYSVNVLNDKFKKSRKDEYEPVRFRGQINCPESIHSDVIKLLEQEVNHIGGGASRGLGAIRIKAKLAEKNDVPGKIKERIRAWNTQIADQIEKAQLTDLVPLREPWSKLPERADLLKHLRSGQSAFVSIDLISDAVLDDIVRHGDNYISTGRQHFVLTEEFLLKASSCKGGVKLLLSNSSPSYRSGWNLAWKLPRDVSLIAKAGGSFVYWIENLEQWLEPLAKLETDGLGREREQGFGEIEVCSPERME